MLRPIVDHLVDQWGAKIASFLGERSDYGVDSLGPTQQDFNRYLQYHKIESLLPYRGYDKTSQLFYNVDSIGFVLQCHPMVGCSQEMQREISGLFQYSLPEGTNIQFLLFADPRIEATLHAWAAPRAGQGDVLARLATRRVEYLDGLAQASSHTPLRDFTCVISFSRNGHVENSLDRQAISDLRSQVMTALKTLQVPLKIMDGQDLINFLELLINYRQKTQASDLPWNPYTNIASQIAAPGNRIEVAKEELRFGDGEQVMRAYSVRREPDYWSLYSMGELIGESIGEFKRLHTPFLLHYGVHISAQEATKTRVQSRESWVENQARTKIGKRVPILVQQARELDFVRGQVGKGERFVETNFSVLLFGSARDIARHEQTLSIIFRSHRWQLQRERYLPLQIYLSCLPMMWGSGIYKDLSYHGRLKTTLSTESANLLPIQGEWKGTSSPGMLLVGRRGQVFTWSPFDNNAGNYNVCVVGRSGSGKSVFMQELMTSTLGMGGQVFVLDVGRSFEKTVKLLQGQYIEFTTTSSICINPFTSIPKDSVAEALDSLAMLKPIISLMTSPVDGTNDLENAHIEQALKYAWAEKGNGATMSDVAHYLLSHKDSIAVNLGNKLYPYTKDGIYGRFFNGPATVDLNHRLVVVELEELKERKDLQAVIVQMVILQITNKLYLGDRKTPSNLVLDEAWDMLRGGRSGEFIETAARRLRKYYGSLVVGTQSVNDFYASAGAQAAFDNSDWMCLLSQKKESIAHLKKTQRMNMEGGLEEMLASVHTVQGQYAEVLINGPTGYAVGRLLLDPYCQVAYSTKATEFSAVQDLVRQGHAMADAIDQVARSKG